MGERIGGKNKLSLKSLIEKLIVLMELVFARSLEFVMNFDMNLLVGICFAGGR